MIFKKQINEFSTLCVNTIRVLAAEAITKAKSGHPGIALGAAPIIYSLFRNHLNVNVNDPFYFNRDRFVLSAGHGSAMLYAAMLISGYKSIAMEDFKEFRQLNSKCPGHPENHILPGIDVGTGPLGQGIAIGVGMAIAEAKLAHKFNKYGKFINHNTYVLFGDGCLEEGVAQEAIAIAGRLKLNKLIMLYDSNKIQLDGKVSDSTNYKVRQLFKANNWNYLHVSNGNNTASVSNAIARAKLSTKPTVIEINTIIGFGSRFQNTNKIHGSPLNDEQIKELRENLNYKIPPFVIHPSVTDDMKIVSKRGITAQKNFNLGLQKLELKDLNLYNEYIRIAENKFNFDLNWYTNFQVKPEVATRTLFSDVLQPALENNDTFFVGAADLTASTLIKANKSIPFSNSHKEGQNIYYGVREFAMASINLGITAHTGCKCITSTFLSFSDYCKNAIRLAAIEHVPAINVFSHDSLTVGEDGPTHQPIEQIPSLRLIPNHSLFRPCNLSECIYALQYALLSTDKPTTIITSRGTFKQYPSDIEEVKRGAYIIYSCDNHQLTILSTGSEVATAIEVAELLKDQIKIRVVSIPSVDVFEQQGSTYKDSIIDKNPIVSIELSSTAPWYKYADLTIGIDQFGKSGKPNDILNHFDLTPEKIKDKILIWYNSYNK
ncbi:MAG: transketolase [Mycoplasmataceae bacterium]|nr:transketolase [Mycoplasmataceae bacterium]